MRKYIADHPKGKDGIHRYRPEEYGVDPATVRKDFATYIDRFGLEPEASDGHRHDATLPGDDARVAHARVRRARPRCCSSTRCRSPQPEAGEVRVRVQAIPFNLNDLERITGGNMMVRPELPYSPGHGGHGRRRRVRRRHRGTGSGRRVVAMPKQARRRLRRVRDLPGGVRRSTCPTSIPLPDAAALYFPFHLAWLGLFDRAELQAGESVLIHAAAGGSGSAAIQLAKHAGARVFATAGTDEKVQLCRDLGADVAINYNDDRLRRGRARARPANRGVDVVFDNVGEAVMEKSMQCTAYNGRYLMMGFASNKVVADEPFIVPRRIALGNFKLCGVLLAYAERRRWPRW